MLVDEKSCVIFIKYVHIMHIHVYYMYEYVFQILFPSFLPSFLQWVRQKVVQSVLLRNHQSAEMGFWGWKQGEVLRLLPAGRFFFNVVVFLQLEWGVWSGHGGCLRCRSGGLSKAVLLSYLLWMGGVGRRGNDELGTAMGL